MLLYRRAGQLSQMYQHSQRAVISIALHIKHQHAHALSFPTYRRVPQLSNNESTAYYSMHNKVVGPSALPEFRKTVPSLLHASRRPTFISGPYTLAILPYSRKSAARLLSGAQVIQYRSDIHVGRILSIFAFSYTSVPSARSEPFDAFSSDFCT